MSDGLSPLPKCAPINSIDLLKNCFKIETKRDLVISYVNRETDHSVSLPPEPENAICNADFWCKFAGYLKSVYSSKNVSIPSYKTLWKLYNHVFYHSQYHVLLHCNIDPWQSLFANGCTRRTVSGKTTTLQK